MAQGFENGRKGIHYYRGICNAIMPNFNPSDEDIDKVLSTLGQQNEKVLKCAYCGDKASEWDHFIAVTNKKKPSGYITEINNLIPSCGKCNQSRGNKDPIAWMSGDARHCPKTRRVKNIEGKIEF